MDTYTTIDAGGAWRRYHATEVPLGWRILGAIHCENDDLMGVLGQSRDGLYAMFYAGTVRPLDQRAVALALARVRLPATDRSDGESLQHR